MVRALVYAAIASIAGTAAAQQVAPKPSAQAAVTYESAFIRYQPYKEEAVADWRAVNDEVGRIGGHVGMFGGASHGGHGPAKPSTGAAEAGQPPVRGAPKAPASTGSSAHH
jgi:hypothetical protein